MCMGKPVSTPKPLDPRLALDDDGHLVVEKRHLNDRPGFRLSLTHRQLSLTQAVTDTPAVVIFVE